MLLLEFVTTSILCKICDTGELELRRVPVHGLLLQVVGCIVAFVTWPYLVVTLIYWAINSREMLEGIVRAGETWGSVALFTWMLSVLGHISVPVLATLIARRKKILQCDNCSAVVPAS